MNKSNAIEKPSYESDPFSPGFIEVFTEAVVVTDLSGCFLSANTAFFTLFPLKPAQCTGQRLPVIAGGYFNCEEIRNLLGKIVPEKLQTHTTEILVETQPGTVRRMAVRARISPFSHEGKPLLLLTFTELFAPSDTQPAKWTWPEHSPEPAQNPFRVILEHGKDIFLITSPRKIEFLSANVTRILGYSREEFIATPPEHLVHPDDQPLRWGELTEPGSTLLIEYRIRHKNGSWRWIEGFGVNLSHHPQVNGLVFTLRDISDRKQAEQELKQVNAHMEDQIRTRTQDLARSEALLKDAQKVSKIGSWELDLESGQVVWSEQLYEIFGYDKNLPAPGFDEQQCNFSPEGWAKLTALVDRAIDLGEPYETDLEIIRMDGSRGFAFAKGQPFLNKNGQVSRLMGVAQDITERKQVEMALAEVSQRLRVATQSARIGIYQWNIGDNSLHWDDTMFEVYGVSRASFSGQYVDWRITLHPDDREQAEKDVYDAVAELRPFDSLFRIIWPNGETRFIKAFGIIIKDHDGKPVSLLGTNQDITPLKQAEAVIAEQRETFQHILEQSLAGFWDLNMRERTVKFSPTFKKMYGYQPDEVEESIEFWQSLLVPEDQPITRKALDEHIRSAGKVPYHCEVRYRHRDGRILTVLSKGAVIEWDENGQPVRMVGSHVDISKRVETEVALERSRKELEAFSYSVSHDLRAPLRGIDGWSLALQEDYADRLDERGLQYLSRVRNETQRMGQLIDDLLKLSRISRTQMTREPVNLSALATHVAERLLSQMPDRNISCRIAPNLQAKGEPNLIEVMLTNLFSNAFKFTSKAGHPEVEFGEIFIDNEQVFFIRDNGVGFNLSLASNLFGAFQRMHKQSEFPGTGIGLATVHRVVSLHQGKIWANSDPGQGATFYFTLNPPNLLI